jgi:hypothetical protein
LLGAPTGLPGCRIHIFRYLGDWRHIVAERPVSLVARAVAAGPVRAWGSKGSLGHRPVAAAPAQRGRILGLRRQRTGRGDGRASALGPFRLDVGYTDRGRWAGAERGSSGSSRQGGIRLMAFEDGRGSGGSIGVRGRGGERLLRARHGTSASRRESSQVGLASSMATRKVHKTEPSIQQASSSTSTRPQPNPAHGTNARGATSKESERLQ